MLESKIALKAFLKPSSIADLTERPLASSSLIRSKISTLASTAIPIVRMIPAIPGKVKVPCKAASTDKINETLITTAISATRPAVE